MGVLPEVSDCRLSPRAEADLADIWRYTALRWSTRQADICIEGMDWVLSAFSTSG